MATNIVQNSETLGRRTTTTPQEIGSRPNQARPDISEQQICERAYFIFLARNGEPGSPDADWARAEQELRAEALRKPPSLPMENNQVGFSRDASDRVPVRTQESGVQSGAGIPSSAAVAGVGARRSPVLFSGG